MVNPPLKFFVGLTRPDTPLGVVDGFEGVCVWVATATLRGAWSVESWHNH